MEAASTKSPHEEPGNTKIELINENEVQVSEIDAGSATTFTLSKKDALLLLSLGSLSLMAALDGTSISTALPV
ncbi:hypothetical protein N7456_004403 [Penicillium angulare]|uniref:Uncharacterized protein n=1 Tax=Penicillium angulare TaxID=116970 RepID=A0A9W9KJI4_9EURO|nr:hypothetical protein N7456_004403 [Penicillium angulare]